MEINTIFNEDCLKGMERLPAESIDAIICDLPYGTTACSWDTIIPFDKLWVYFATKKYIILQRKVHNSAAIFIFSLFLIMHVLIDNFVQ